MSEDKLRQDIREILEDARFSITASDEWIDRFIARVRAEDTVKSTGVSLPRDAATAMYQEYSRVGSNLIEGFQAAYAKGYQAGRDDAHFQQLIAEAQQEIKERFDMKPGVVGEPGPDTELSGNAEANTIPWHVAIDNTGRATVGRRISKRVIALVKTSSRYGHVYTKTGPLTYTCTGCGGRIYPISKDTPAVQDHRTGVDGCMGSQESAENTAEEAISTEDTGVNEAQAHPPLARPSSPPPSTLNQARRLRGYAPLPTPTCSCSLCVHARALSTERDTGHWGLD